MTQTGAIVLSRMGSSRLPGKAMLPLCGVPVLEHIVRRLGRVPGLDVVVVAPTTEPQDDLIEHFCRRIGAACFRGDAANVLKRCLDAVEAFGLDAVVRLGGDSPLVDPGLVGRMLGEYRRRAPEYLSNTLDRCFPLGLDAEIFRAGVFRRIRDVVAGLPEDERRRNEENVIVYLHQHPEQFDLASYREEPVLPEARLTLDTPADFVLIERIYDALYPADPAFGLPEVARLLGANPDWLAINAGVAPVSGFWTDTEKRRYEKRFGKHHG